MDNILNITNGDCAVDIMQEAKIAGTFLPWRDVLHEGPVPADLDLDALSKRRAQFIVERNWGSAEQVTASFSARDQQLQAFGDYDKVILWFEHDLYDQLQLVQILDWFQQHFTDELDLAIICSAQYLGQLSAQQMAAQLRFAQPVTKAQLDLASQAWSAFRAETPEQWQQLLELDTSALPFLRAAVIRMLEEYPSKGSGLSRTATQALTLIAQGVTKPGKVFAGNQNCEQQVFLGDASFWVVLHELLDCNPALITLTQGSELSLPPLPEQTLTITDAGKQVLSGQTDWLETAILDRWIGGVHLISNNIWRWDAATQTIIKQA